MGWLSFHSRLITRVTESFPERCGPRCLIDASHIVLYITTTPAQDGKTFLKYFLAAQIRLRRAPEPAAFRSNSRVTHAQWKRRGRSVPIGAMKQWLVKSIQVC